MRVVHRIAGLAAGCLLAAAGLASPASATPVLKVINPTGFQAAVDGAARALQVPGAVVVLRTPQGSFAANVGTTELGTSVTPTPGTHFRIASNTKTMTAALIVLLAQDGDLAFDDPISKYVPDVPNGDNITVAQLLTMRSGLWGYTHSAELAAALDADPAKAWTPQQVLALAYEHPPLFAPGADYDYSNTNYALLGLVAEKVDGRPLREQLQQRLFAPLGLQQTYLPAADDTNLPMPYSHGYMFGESRYALDDLEYPEELQSAARAGTLAPVDYTHQNSSYATAAGGTVSTADDLAVWIRALVSGNVFDNEQQRRWLDSLEPEDPQNSAGQLYGYGITYQQFGPHAGMYYHGGELPGFNSFMGHDPGNDVTLVIWTNLTLSPEGLPSANALLPTVLREIYTELDF